MMDFKFFHTNPHKNKCRLQIGSTFQYHGHYCTVSRMLQNYFFYTVQETHKDYRMSYEYYLKTPSAAGRQLNRI